METIDDVTPQSSEQRVRIRYVRGHPGGFVNVLGRRVQGWRDADPGIPGRRPARPAVAAEIVEVDAQTAEFLVGCGDFEEV